MCNWWLDKYSYLDTLRRTPGLHLRDAFAFGQILEVQPGVDYAATVIPGYENKIHAYARALKNCTMVNAHVVLNVEGPDLFDWPLHQMCDHVGKSSVLVSSKTSVLRCKLSNTSEVVRPQK